MKIDGTPYRCVWLEPSDGWSVRIIDQTRLPWSLEFLRLTTVARGRACDPHHAGARRAADRRRGGLRHGAGDARRPGTEAMERAAAQLNATRPTAVNLRWATDRMLTRLRNTGPPTACASPTRRPR